MLIPVVRNCVAQFLNTTWWLQPMGHFTGPGVDYENIVKVLLYGRVDEGRTSHLSKHTGRQHELLSRMCTAVIDSHLSMVSDIKNSKIYGYS